MKPSPFIPKFLAICLKGVIIILVTFSCSSSTKNKQAELEEQLNKLEKENKLLKQEISQPKATSVYAFVVLNVTQTEQELKAEGPNIESVNIEKSYYYTSEIHELSFFNEAIKYKLMDDFQNEYLSFYSIYKGQVKNRQCFTFGTYQEASRKREQYLISK
ncbi:hypothetical protein [Runella zeae]|uniref:hypothetical protein n=1 Tax=Runella zeae TaxID=94255 RepID=UPI0023554936|nr:hypothetical protein [Runella zeae]